MKYITRHLNLQNVLNRKSCFLFGPRQTGKSSLISQTLGDYRVYDLLDSATYLSLSRNPRRLEQELHPHDEIVIIDEIQKLPSLLDEVHRLIEKRHIRFLLTGSSARKLRRGGINLLGGRARHRYLHPFIQHELGEQFDLLTALNHGLIPSIYGSDAPEEDLKSYAGDYLALEIAAEGLTRNIPAFSRFLEAASLCNGQLINYTNIANDAQVSRSTVQEYFQILRDTLIAFDVPAWKKSTKRKPISTAKFYFFDPGVVRHLQHRGPCREKSPEFGAAFETYIAHELKAFSDYQGIGDLYYWRSKSGYEVDFILNDRIAIEIKAKPFIQPSDLKGLRALREENQLEHYLVVSLETHPRIVDGIGILPWMDFLNRLWQSDF